jgi:cyanophycin synthetase
VEQNPGRLNIFSVRNFTVMVDYAHNADGYRSIIETARQLPHSRLIGVVSAAGDRYSHKLQEIGRICGEGFDELFIREMTDRRGRAPGETAGLIREGALESGLDRNRLHVVLDGAEAIDQAIALGQEGDLIVVGCADTHDIIDAVRRHATELHATQAPGISVTWLPESETAERPNL